MAPRVSVKLGTRAQALGLGEQLPSCSRESLSYDLTALHVHHFLVPQVGSEGGVTPLFL